MRNARLDEAQAGIKTAVKRREAKSKGDLLAFECRVPKDSKER